MLVLFIMVVYVKFLHGIPAPTSLRYIKYVLCVAEGFLCIASQQSMLSVVFKLLVSEFYI